MNQPLVSVVIPTYNRAYCLARAVDSVLGQTYGNVEAIVVDDGSTDGTAALVDSRYGGEPRVHYVRQPNQGVAAARNTGFAAARGEFIALLDSDDVWYSWKLAVQVGVLQRFPDVGMVWTDMQAIDANGAVMEPKHLRTMYGAYRWFRHGGLFSQTHRLGDIVPAADGVDASATVSCGDIFSQIALGNLVHTSTVLLRRARLEKVAGFDVALTPVGEDYDFHLRTCREGPVAFVDVSSIQYQREFGDQLTQPGYALKFAQAHLAIISRTFREDRHRIHLPPELIAACFADAHGWIGHAAMDRGDAALARTHLACSLRHGPWQIRTGLMLLLACLPSAAGNHLRAPYRRLKRMLLALQPPRTSERPRLIAGSAAHTAR